MGRYRAHCDVTVMDALCKTLQRDIIQNKYPLIHESAFENVVCVRNVFVQVLTCQSIMTCQMMYPFAKKAL